MLEVEEDVLGISHATVGEALASKWQLPKNLIQVIGTYHAPGGGDTPDMMHLVHLSDVCSKQIGFAFEERAKDVVPTEQTLERIGLGNEALSAVFKELEPTVRKQVADTFAAIFK